MPSRARPTNPCKRNCSLRRWDCHTWCEQYKQYEKSNAEERTERYKKKDTMYYTIDQIKKVQAKNAKNRNKWGNRED